ncbi:MAG: hypothetical protein LBQ10_06680, partial [Desulfovibrio sp.]|nr:hypothetical protein [Desulfovibrio sp.]
FNSFYRANRNAIYRNPEGVEFPLYFNGKVIKQGSGEIIAYLLSGHALEVCVTRSDMLHGRISGIYLSQCPEDQEENLHILVERLAAGGLQVWLQTDGRKPDLLENFLKIKGVRVICNIVGSGETTAKIFGGTPDVNDLGKTIDLVRSSPEGLVRFLAAPLPNEDGWAWPKGDDAAMAARMVAEACGQRTLPFAVTAVTPDMAWDMHGLEPLPGQSLLMYRSAVRRFLFKAEIAK